MKSACVVGLFCLILTLQEVSSIEATSGPKKSNFHKDERQKESAKKPLNTNITQAVLLGQPGVIEYFTLFNTGTNHVFCGGTLITSRHILTTATCIQSGHYNNFAVYVSYKSDDSLEETFVGTSEDLFEHPKFIDNYYDRYNLAIIEMSQDIQTLIPDKVISPVSSILFGANFPVENTPVNIFGVGRNSGIKAKELLKTTLKIKSRSDCRSELEYSDPADDTWLFCAASDTNDARGACPHDDGGPATSEDGSILFGVIGKQSCPPRPGFPTRLIRFTTEIVCWIQEVTDRDFGAFCNPRGLSCDVKAASNGKRKAKDKM